MRPCSMSWRGKSVDERFAISKIHHESLCLGCITGTGTEVGRSAVEPKEAKITNACTGKNV